MRIKLYYNEIICYLIILINELEFKYFQGKNVLNVLMYNLLGMRH